MIYKYCQRCGKRLKGEENRIRGFGKICYEKARAEAQGLAPLITPTRAQEQREIKRLKAEEQRARAEAEELSRARARLQARSEQEQSRASEMQGKASKSQSREQDFKENFSSRQDKSKGVKPPHLEQTLTPTYKKGLLFTPHTPPHPADRG